MFLHTNGCWKPNYIPFPLCLWSNEQTNHIQEIWQYVNRRALGSEHASQFSTNQSIVAEFRRALCFQATKRLICILVYINIDSFGVIICYNLVMGDMPPKIFSQFFLEMKLRASWGYILNSKSATREPIWLKFGQLIVR